MKYLFRYSWTIIILFLSSCLPEFSCDEWAKDFRDNAKFNLVLSKKENNESRDAYFYGTDLYDKETTEFHDGGGWIAHNFDKFKIGDTLIKEVGKYTIVIKRKGKILLVPFVCDDKTYVDK